MNMKAIGSRPLTGWNRQEVGRRAPRAPSWISPEDYQIQIGAAGAGFGQLPTSPAIGGARGARRPTCLRHAVLLWVLLSVAAGAAEFKLPGHTFTVPDGFEVLCAARGGAGLVDRPIVADFDEQGRLYVADSSGSNEKLEKQLQTKPHRIVRLEDTD